MSRIYFVSGFVPEQCHLSDESVHTVAIDVICWNDLFIVTVLCVVTT